MKVQLALAALLAITQLTEVLSKETTEESKKRIEEKSDSSPAETSSLGTEVEGGQKKTEKRGLYGSYGDLGSSSSYGGGWESQDHDYHVKTVTIEKKVPVPYPVVKVEHVDRPYPVKVPQPYAVHVPQPYPVEKKIYIDRPYEVVKHVPQPYPVDRIVEKKIHVPYEVKVHVPVPAPYPVEKKIHVPYEVKVPVHIPQPYPVEKKIFVDRPIHIKVPLPYPVIKEKHIPYPVKEFIKVPVIKEHTKYVDRPVIVEKVVEKKVPYAVPVHVKHEEHHEEHHGGFEPSIGGGHEGYGESGHYH